MPSEEISNEEVHLKSLDRVQKYPIVNDSLVLAISYYQWLKSKNSIIDNTLCRAERTLKSIKDTTEPIVVKQCKSILFHITKIKDFSLFSGFHRRCCQ